MQLVVLIARKNSHSIVGNVGPFLKLMLPLEYRYRIGRQTDSRHFNGLCGRDARQGFASATGQDDNARSRTAIAKHFGQTSFLIPSNSRNGFQIHEWYIGICVIIPEIIFLH